MDSFIQQQLNSIEQMARYQLEVSQHTLRIVERIFGYCAGMETVAKDYPPALLQENLVGYGNQNKSTTLEEIKEMIVELKIKGSVRERANGLIELRTQTLGSIYGRTKEEIETKLTQKLKEAKKKTKEKDKFSVPTNFDKFAMYWFENFHKRKVVEATYKKNIATYRHDIQKVFEKVKLKDILPAQIQKFLEAFNNKERTKETLHSLLNQIFDCAVKHGLVKLNPLDMCFYQKHEREHGVAISKKDELKLISAYKGTGFELDFPFILYTGLRPCEYKSAVFLGRFIKAQNCKRKGGKIEYKNIPVSPMLKPYVGGLTAIKLHHPATLDKKLKAVLPNHTLKDMRTTFQTRLDECGIPDKVIGVVMGNTIGKGDRIKETYTDTQSDEYLEYLYKWLQQFKY